MHLIAGSAAVLSAGVIATIPVSQVQVKRTGRTPGSTRPAAIS
jgi:hypothetical protein